MPAPHTPNPGPGATARSANARQRRLELCAAQIRAAGGTCTLPQQPTEAATIGEKLATLGRQLEQLSREIRLIAKAINKEEAE